MNEWRIDLGLPTRLQHPALVTGAISTYIFVDYAPQSKPFVGDGIEHLQSKFDRKRVEKGLRAAVQNKLELPPSLRKSVNYPCVQYRDDDGVKPPQSDWVPTAERFAKAALRGLKLKHNHTHLPGGVRLDFSSPVGEVCAPCFY